MPGDSIATVFITALLLGLIPAAVARSKGRSFAGWWVYGTLLWIVALPHSLVLNHAPVPGTDKKCPECAERVRTEAKVCRFCAYRFTERELEESRYEAESIRKRDAARERRRRIAAVIAVGSAFASVSIMGVWEYYQEKSQGERAAASSRSNYNSIRQTAVQPTQTPTPYPSTATVGNSYPQPWQTQAGQPTPPIYVYDPRYSSGSVPQTAPTPGQQESPISSPTMPDNEDYSRTFNAKDVTRKAILNSKPNPGFSEEARANYVSGVVKLRLVLRADGTVSDISVVKGLPDGLTERAIAAAQRIQFTPAQKNGRNVSQWVTVEYNFNIY